MNTIKNIKWSGLLLVLFGLLLAGSSGFLDRDKPDRLGKRSYIPTKKLELIYPGLQAAITGHELSGTQLTVTFTVTDEAGRPLDRAGNYTPGSISASFVLGTIPRDGTQYVSYTNRVQTSPITGDSAVQASSDSGGTITEIEQGTYTYTFAAQFPEDYDPTATHTVGGYFSRDLREFDLNLEVDNVIYHFVPDGSEVMQVRDVVRTETCNNCHDPLAFHGGRRTDMELCVMCHTTGVIDPDTGNSVDMPEMIHKIHMGVNLPSVQAGTPYQIIGFRQSVHDYSEVIFPQAVSNCESCHTDAAGAVDHERWLTAPDRDSCGSCHDNVNWATGEGHVNLPQISDNLCANCHFPQGELEYDASIRGAHQDPLNSSQFAGINMTITGVTDSGPGQNPTVSFTMTDDAGNMVDLSTLNRFNITIAGPNDDYSVLMSESALGAAADGDGYSYTFENTIPDDASGSYTAGAEIFRNFELNTGTVNAFTVRESANVPVFPFAVTDIDPSVRRMIVMQEKCESCHGDLRAHGTFRQNVDYCVTCHNPASNDAPFRSEDMFPAESVDFKFMIHRLHMGEYLQNGYTVVGFMGSIHDYSHVVYPGDLRNCEACHVDDSYLLPSAGVLDTPTPYDFFSPLPPQSAACLSCHDSLEAAAHAYTNISPFGESCASCHGQGMEFDVGKIHAR
ncbi:MAG: OmcA/MtrC family decaheme c-type cytochrome [Acidobacteriota bacterium]|nr:OmcA/MtrC family decaheme c-type cytochrome [Acidobacteriota bacterium]